MFSKLLAPLLLPAAFLPGADAPKRTNTGPWRLQYHFTAPQNWNNDPNGLVYYKDEYHLFYQFNPFGTKWGHMSWGHAVSPDLVHWRDLPVALPEENGIMMFSGSAVVDQHNSSGLCKSSGGDTSCLIAIYTGHTPERQRQNIAYSNDRGRTWTKYSGNPVIDLHLKDFRDPKVLWYEPQKKWVMVTALSDQHKLRFFESRDLIHWTALSDFGPAGASEGVWECPDLFELPVQGSRESRWVASVGVGRGGVAGGPGVQYFVGRFDGRSFTNDNPPSQKLWLDYGKDYYAAVSYFGDKPGSKRRIMVGWFANPQYAGDTPETDWHGGMTLPREITLYQTSQGIRVRQKPVGEIESLRQPISSAHVVPVSSRSLDVAEANRRLNQATADGKRLEAIVTFAAGSSTHFGVRVFQGPQNATEIGIDRAKSVLYIDRTHSGITDFNKNFAGRQEAPLPAGDAVTLHIFLDRSSIEVFGNEGAVVFSERAYPLERDTRISLFAEDEAPRITNLQLYRIKSIWENVPRLDGGAELIPVRK